MLPTPVTIVDGAAQAEQDSAIMFLVFVLLCFLPIPILSLYAYLRFIPPGGEAALIIKEDDANIVELRDRTSGQRGWQNLNIVNDRKNIEEIERRRTWPFFKLSKGGTLFKLGFVLVAAVSLIFVIWKRKLIFLIFSKSYLIIFAISIIGGILFGLGYLVYIIGSWIFT